MHESYIYYAPKRFIFCIRIYNNYRWVVVRSFDALLFVADEHSTRIHFKRYVFVYCYYFAACTKTTSRCDNKSCVRFVIDLAVSCVLTQTTPSLMNNRVHSEEAICREDYARTPNATGVCGGPHEHGAIYQVLVRDHNRRFHR